MHVPGVRVESATHLADVAQVPQEGNTFRQSDVLVEAKERAVQLFRDIHIFVQHTTTCQLLHAPVPEGAVAKTCPRTPTTRASAAAHL